MYILVTIFYMLFCALVVYPPAEFISAGFTILQLFEDTLGSENTNFIHYHTKRITITTMIHSILPPGYVACLWWSGLSGSLLLSAISISSIVCLCVLYKVVCWVENDMVKHPAIRGLMPYVTRGSDWRVIAAELNGEYADIDKLCIQINATTKFIATETWIIKVTQYGLNTVKQIDCDMVATSIDTHSLTPPDQDSIQYVNIETIPIISGIPRFKFRITDTALQELQSRLAHPVRVPQHLPLQPALIIRFLVIFKYHVEQNSVYYVDQELEECIGCMTAKADVAIKRRCGPKRSNMGENECADCRCRPMWCCECLGRWWAARAKGSPATWLDARCTCPACRAPFCLRDVLPARARAHAHAHAPPHPRHT